MFWLYNVQVQFSYVNPITIVKNIVIKKYIRYEPNKMFKNKACSVAVVLIGAGKSLWLLGIALPAQMRASKISENITAVSTEQLHIVRCKL